MHKILHITPGEILQNDFLIPMGITVAQLSRTTGICENVLNDILLGQGRITAEIGLRLSLYFNTSPLFWVGIQNQLDLRKISEGKII